MRKVYDLSTSKLKEECTNEEVIKEDKVMLFGTSVCPNCKMAKEFLKKAKIDYEWVNAEENVELTKDLGVKQAPTLVIIKNNNVEKIANLSNIKKYTEEMRPVKKKGKEVVKA